MQFRLSAALACFVAGITRATRAVETMEADLRRPVKRLRRSKLRVDAGDTYTAPLRPLNQRQRRKRARQRWVNQG